MTTTKTTTLRLAHGRRQSPESANPCSSAQWPPASILLRSTLIRPNSPRRTVPFRRSELSPSTQKRAAPSNNTDTRTQKTSPPQNQNNSRVQRREGRRTRDLSRTRRSGPRLAWRTSSSPLVPVPYVSLIFNLDYARAPFPRVT